MGSLFTSNTEYHQKYSGEMCALYLVIFIMVVAPVCFGYIYYRIDISHVMFCLQKIILELPET